MTDAELENLFHEMGYLVERRCRILLSNRADAEDALQDVFMRAAHYGATQKTQATLSWLYAIAFNVCCDRLARRKREQPQDPALMSRLGEASTGAPDEADRRAVVSQTLRSVGKKTREIAVLHHLGGFTQEEVAARIGYSRKTVGKKLQAFAQRLKEGWVDP